MNTNANLAEEAHYGCSIHEPCAAKDPARCPEEKYRRMIAQRDTGTPWSELEVRREPGGLRHYLDGRPVHCGTALELQAVEYKEDDAGDYTRALPRGAVVRYEATQNGVTINATLHRDVDGHEFGARCEAWFRFRWPR